METTLLVLAAGMGSRYGGLKQMDPLGPGGEALLDYSVFDAIRSGFSRVVFVIRRDFESEFRERVGRRFEGHVDIGYVFQQLNDLPEGFEVPEGRSKPWGTGHAIWCARDAIDTPFLAINADDFYGFAAISAVGQFLSGESPWSKRFCMAGYRLDTTLSPNGPVSRGVCTIGADGRLAGIQEFTKISRTVAGISCEGNVFHGDERVSLNCWGFTPAVFSGLEDLFTAFLSKHGADEKSEFYIPDAVFELVRGGLVTVDVLPVAGPWFGVTYREDRPEVVSALQALVQKGDYPNLLWNR